MKLGRVAGRRPKRDFSSSPNTAHSESGAGGETSQVGVAYYNTWNWPGVLVRELKFFPTPETGAHAGGSGGRGVGWAKAGWRRRPPRGWGGEERGAGRQGRRGVPGVGCACEPRLHHSLAPSHFCISPSACEAGDKDPRAPAQGLAFGNHWITRATPAPLPGPLRVLETRAAVGAPTECRARSSVHSAPQHP